MTGTTDQSNWPLAWSVGGFLFPVAIYAIGAAFERGHPPSQADLERAWVHPDTLNLIVNGLVVAHLAALYWALARWRDRGWVWAATAVQIAGTLVAWFLAGMAVYGTWM
jgi:hypothetical protein